MDKDLLIMELEALRAYIDWNVDEPIVIRRCLRKIEEIKVILHEEAHKV